MSEIRRDRFGNYVRQDESVVHDWTIKLIPVSTQISRRNFPTSYVRPGEWQPPFKIATLPSVAGGMSPDSNSRTVLVQIRHQPVQRQSFVIKQQRSSPFPNLATLLSGRW